MGGGAFGGLLGRLFGGMNGGMANGMNAGMNGGPMSETLNWSCPVMYWMTFPKEKTQEALNVFSSFIQTFDFSSQLRAIREQDKMQGIQEAHRNSYQHEQMLQQMQAQQDARWAAVERNAQRMSADLDEFRQNNWNQMQENDARRAAYFSQSSPGYGSGSSNMGFSDESADDRIQRLRHESMMGVNTYEREDGSEVEFSTQADRVFEQNLDSLNHVGTEHYLDDYVPDGWTELDRKQ